MTTEERFERIARITAGLAEQFRNEREENRLLWRETRETITRLAHEFAEADKRLEARIEQMGAESRAADERLREQDERLQAKIEALGDRIDKLVSGIGKFISK